jgi:hypothetical protein
MVISYRMSRQALESMNSIRPILLSSLLAISVAVPALCVEKGDISIATPVSESQSATTQSAAPSAPIRKTWIKVGAGRSDFLVFVKPEAGFAGRMGGDDDVVIIGAQGAVLSTDNQKPVLHDGAVLITCRRGTMKLTTKIATISIPQGATVLVDRVPSAYSVKVAMVSGSTQQEVLAGSKRGHQSFGLHPGQEVTFSEASREAAVKSFDRNALRPEVSQLVQNAHIATAPLRMLGEEGSEFRCSGPDTVFLRCGEMFMQVPDKVVIQTPVADVVGGKSAVIDVDADADFVRLKAFSGPGHAMLVAGERTLNVSPGEEFTAAPHDISETDIYIPDGVARRRDERIKLTEKLFGAHCEFSMVSFFNAAPYVQPLKRASAGDDKVMLDRILKTAASLFTVTQGHGAYRSVSRITRKRSNPGNQHQAGGSA